MVLLLVGGASRFEVFAGSVDSLTFYSLRDEVLVLATNSPEEALLLAEQGELMAQVAGDFSALARILSAKGLAYEYLDSLDRALRTYDLGLNAAIAAHDTAFEASLIMSKGIACYFSGDYLNAHAFYEEALLKFQTLNDLAGESQALNNLGIVYRYSGEYAKAIEIYLRSLEIKAQLGDSLGMANTYHNLGSVYGYLEQDTSSLGYFERAFDLYTSLNSGDDVPLVQAGMGISLYNLGRPEEALGYFEASYEAISKRKNWDYVTHIFSYGRTLHDLGFMEKGRPLLEEGYRYLHASGQRKNLLRHAEDYMYQIAREDGDTERALMHLENFRVLNDSITNERRDRLFSEMQAKYELRGKENTILKQELEIEQAAKSRTRMAGGIALLVFLALTGGWFSVQKQRANKALAEQKRIVEKALGDRELMLREIHHRVKNNLQIISGLLSIQSMNVKDEAARDAINSSRTRVRSMALIHQNLYHEGEKITTVEMPNYIRRLTKEIIDTMGDDDCHITTNVDVCVTDLDVDVAIPLGLILNELITNSVKYAFQGRSQGNISVSLQTKDDEIVLVMQDDGHGLRDSLNERSFGQRMMASLSESLKATFTLSSDHGVRAELRIPQKHQHE